MTETASSVLADTARWIQRAVIGLNLCPFARGPYVKGQVHCAASDARDWGGVEADLERESISLLAQPATQCETTLLVLPHALQDFYEFNGFLAQAQRCLEAWEMADALQLASFHPDYQFADAAADDITNFTNRAPYPVLQLLRTASVAKAVQAVADASVIYEANRATLRRLGHGGWAQLQVDRP